MHPDGKIRRVELDTITAHHFARGRGRKFAIMCETRWKHLKRLSWERDAGLQDYFLAILRYWNRRPIQCGSGHLQ